MYKVSGIALNGKGKTYFFNSQNFDLKKKMNVIVETEKGLQYGQVVVSTYEVADEDIGFSLKNVIRIATKEDEKKYLKNQKDANNAVSKAREIASQMSLNMNIIDATYNFDRTQLLFNFLADARVDFREYAKKLAQIYKTRIELRQIGVRDKAKEIGGIGPCGRILCCSSFLTNFESVSINMAKNQGIALNPTKINGVCGRLLCCLNYENEQYMEVRKNIPDVGKKVKINGKEGKVISSEPLAGKYKVFVDNEIVQVDVNDSKE